MALAAYSLVTVCSDFAKQRETLKIPVRAREKQIHYREAENHYGKIENAKLRGARSAPTWLARQPKIKSIRSKNKEGDDIFRVVVPDLASQPINPHETERRADGDRDETHQDAALAHAVEKIERGQAPDDIADAVFVQ